MIAYQTNDNWVFVGEVFCDPNPREPGSFLVPGHAVTIEPPVYQEGEWARWDGNSWIVEEAILPEPDFPEIEEIPLTKEMVELNRLAAYQLYADPVFFKWQAGLATKEDWDLARASVNEMHPYPEEE